MDSEKPKAMSLEAFVSLQKELLEIEHKAELDQASEMASASVNSMEKKGMAVAKLFPVAMRTGMYGRTVITLQKNMKQELPANSLTTGESFSLTNTVFRILERKRFTVHMDFRNEFKHS